MVIHFINKSPEIKSPEISMLFLIFSLKVIECNKWQKRLGNRHYTGAVNLTEKLTKGFDSLNRLRTVYTCSKEHRKRWGYDGDTTCACGQDPETTTLILRCPLLTQPCTLDNLLKFYDITKR